MKTITDEMKDFSSEIKSSSVDTDILNPFVHRLELDTTYDKLKTAFLTVALLPLRLALITGLVIFAWLLACLGLHGLSDEDLRRTPLTGWRRDMRVLVCWVMRAMFICGGFHQLKVKGQKATTKDAPVLALAPHSSFFDALPVVYLGGPSIVAKAETGKIPFFGMPWLCFVGQLTYRAAGMKIVIRGKQASRSEAPILVVAPHSTFIDGGIVYILGFPSTIVRRESGLNPFVGKLINYTQPVYVWRDDPNSRQNTIKEIIERATSKEDWPQIMIFPEGTCTNRSCLITFKCGAFYPGVPVQPVCIRYPNKLDTVTWTWEGPGPLKLLWLTLTQLNSSCEIEFLPVYKPNEAEKTDPKLYANNVRRVMAQALGIPVSDYTYDDCRIISKAHSLNLPNAFSILDTHKLRNTLGLQNNKVEQELIQKRSHKIDEAVDFNEFARILRLDSKDPLVQQLFKIYDKTNKGYVDMEEYIFTVLAIEKANSVLDLLAVAFDVCSMHSSRYLNIQKLRKVLRFSLQLDAEESDKIFLQVHRDSSDYDSVSLEEILTVLRTRAEFNHLFTADSDDRKKKTI